MAEPDVDIFVGNNIIFDPDVYQLWIDGHSAQEAAVIIQKRGILQQYGATFELLLSDTSDHFRTFQMLERLIQNPPKLAEQLCFQISPDTQKQLIEKYFQFDLVVIRETLGKKLSARNRNALDDVSDKTKVPLRSCRRQFDNMKRVFKVVEDMTGSLEDNIKANFLLSDELAQQYAAIMFIANNRFETSKKKISYLTFDDFVFCAYCMIKSWSFSSKDCKDHEDQDQDMDRDFLQDIRDFKILLEKEHLDDHRHKTIALIKPKLSAQAAGDIDSMFKVLAKVLMNMAHNLNHSKELRDFFMDIVEKIIDPCKQAGWTQSDLQYFLAAYTDTGLQLDIIKRNPRLIALWERYMRTMMSCIIKMYHT